MPTLSVEAVGPRSQSAVRTERPREIAVTVCQRLLRPEVFVVLSRCDLVYLPDSERDAQSLVGLKARAREVHARQRHGGG